MIGNQTDQPNHIALQGEEIKIIYDSTSFIGQPQLTYEDAAGVLNFRGGDVRKLNTEIGRLVTVVTGRVNGVTSAGATVTILIPQFDFNGEEVAFTTKAIITMRPPAPAESELRGCALQGYSVEEMKGTAQKVYS